MALSQKALHQLLTHCPHCAAPFEQLVSTRITENQQAELVHVHCQTCQGSLVALLYTTGPLVSSIGLISDLSPNDVIHFQHTSVINEDDLFRLHDELSARAVVGDILTQIALQS